MKIVKLTPQIPAWDTSIMDELITKAIDSIQQQVEEQHRRTIYKHIRVSPYKLTKAILERHNLVLVVNPQHNQQWLEQKGERIGPVIVTSLLLPTP